MDNVIMQRGIMRCASQSNARLVVLCRLAYVSGAGTLDGWGRDHLDGEVAVRTDYTGCLQRVELNRFAVGLR